MRVFSNLRAGHVSDGPFFSALPEKKGEKRGAWYDVYYYSESLQTVYGTPNL